jgi:hypothetical protein
MKKSDIMVLAQLLTAIKDGTREIEMAQKDKDAEKLARAKHEILGFQKELERLL